MHSESNLCSCYPSLGAVLVPLRNQPIAPPFYTYFQKNDRSGLDAPLQILFLQRGTPNLQTVVLKISLPWPYREVERFDGELELSAIFPAPSDFRLPPGLDRIFLCLLFFSFLPHCIWYNK